MASKVFHGPTPKWPRVTLQPGNYEITIQGWYTTTPGLTAVGVKKVRWNSKQKSKRQAELLGLRTAFVCWFVATYLQLGGSWAGAVRSLQKYPYRRLQKQLKSGRRGLRYLG